MDCLMFIVLENSVNVTDMKLVSSSQKMLVLSPYPVNISLATVTR